MRYVTRMPDLTVLSLLLVPVVLLIVGGFVMWLAVIVFKAVCDMWDRPR